MKSSDFLGLVLFTGGVSYIGDEVLIINLIGAGLIGTWYAFFFLD